MSEKKRRLMIGNEAVARGIYEAGCNVVSSYPGTPSTEITEFLSKYDDIYSEWAPNEKVALEVAAGASIGGARSFCAMKHVGLNVAADPLYTLSYTGVNGGLVIVVADDPGMHSSQNEQDSRHHARASKTVMLEPSDSQECYEYAKLAYEISEKFDTPVIIRLTTRVAHSQSLVEFGERQNINIKEYVKNMPKFAMMPAMAQKRHIVIEKRYKNLIEYANNSKINKIENNTETSKAIYGRNIGIIASGICYQYAKEAFGNSVSFLKLGCDYPLPNDMIKDFSKMVDDIYVIEELDDIFETYVKKLGINVKGKELFDFCGEYTANNIKKQIAGIYTKYIENNENCPGRPPVLCPGCPHRGIFYVLSKLKVMVSGDIGCYTLGALAPLSALDTTICMGASVSALHGFNKARGSIAEKNSVAVIGDSTFMHSGITGLVDVVYNASNSTVIVLDNSITGMTGHQQNPTTGYNIKGDVAAKVNLEALCKSIGVNKVDVVDPYDLEKCEAVVKEHLSAEEPSVIIARRPCQLLKYVKVNPPFKINKDKCRGCKVCLKIGCPAIKMKNGKAEIDTTLCVGCDLCKKVCKFGAIED